MKNIFLLIASIAIMTACAKPAPTTPSVPRHLAPNEAVGTPRGIHPGRVAWSHVPGAATWTAGEESEPWFSDRFNDQQKTDQLVSSALLALTGETQEQAAWDALFRSFNGRLHGEKRPYAAGEKIAIKANMNNSYGYEDSGEINASPHLLLSLLRSLVGEAGIPEECITLFDASRFMTNSIYQKCHGEFPNVRYVDNEGGEGRIRAEYVDDAIPYSVDNGQLARGLATCAVEADYLIDVALLKGHVGQGVTLCGKNWYGVTSIHRDWRKNHHNHFNADREGKMTYHTFVDFMGHKDLGQKAMLFLIDGLYGSPNVDGLPVAPWQMKPFCGEWPCSLFASEDGVAIDAVCTDFLLAEFPTMPDVAWCDMYLVEAALADNPPSGTVYDPERDGTSLPSLGVAEHWNNADDKHYETIELVYVKK